MVFIYVPHKNDGKKASPRETTVALLIVALIVLGFALFAVIVGPKSGNPPPPIVAWVLFTLFIIFGFVAFFNWLHWQGQGDAPSQDSDSEEEK